MENVLSSRFAHSAMRRKFRDPKRSAPKKRMNQDKSFNGKVRQYLSRTLFMPDHVSEILERVRRVQTVVSDSPKPTAQERFLAMELDAGRGPWLVAGAFGLMLVEGMMFGKPVIGCRAGGMVKVVENGKIGLFTEPGEVASLEACLNRLIEEPELRARLGASARKCYENCFKVHLMTVKVVAFVSKIGGSCNCPRYSPVPPDVNI
jgi:glycosyltransferase involved in cell wall biosynthesis